MNSKTVLPILILLSAMVSSVAWLDAEEPHKKLDKHPGLEQFKQLAGNWVGTATDGDKLGKKIRVRYQVTSGGSAVVETIDPGKAHEMVTVIHPDGKNLVLTHYCSLGNQPRMRSEGKVDGKRVTFKFADATNMKSDKDMHMHAVTFTGMVQNCLFSGYKRELGAR